MKISKAEFNVLLKESWKVCWPMALIMFFQFFIGLADVYVAGRINKEIQAAYGLAFQLYMAGLIPAIAFTAGTVSVVSRLFTAREKDPGKTQETLHQAVVTAIVAAVSMGVVCSAFGFFFSRTIINFLNVPTSIKDYSAEFAQIYSLGLIFEFFMINSNGVLRSCGKIKISLINYAYLCILNIILNILLTFYTPLGYRGIAVATVISIAVGVLLNSMALRTIVRNFVFRFQFFKEIVSIGWPIGLLQVLWNLASLVIFSFLSRLPKDAIEIIAAFTNGLKVESVIFLPIFAFNMANAVVVGNLLGKDQKARAYTSGIITAIIGFFLALIMSVAVIANARYIMHLLSNNEIVVKYGVQYLYISLLFEPIMAWGVILAGGLAGAGYTKHVLFAIALSVWGLRIPLCYFLGIVTGFGAVAIWWAMNASILLQAIILTYSYIRKMRPVLNLKAGS